VKRTLYAITFRCSSVGTEHGSSLVFRIADQTTFDFRQMKQEYRAFLFNLWERFQGKTFSWADGKGEMDKDTFNNYIRAKPVQVYLHKTTDGYRLDHKVGLVYLAQE
jgi:hypothetical protein